MHKYLVRLLQFSLVSIVLLAQQQLFAQESKGTISGIVSDTSGTPMAGATIHLKNTSFNALSNQEGKYVLQNIPAGSYEVEVVLLGYKSPITNVVVKAGSVTEIQHFMEHDMKELPDVAITGLNSKNGMAHLKDVEGTVIYSGKKTEVLVMDSLDANTAQNNPRQILGRIPGMNFSETEGAGFPSNGIGSRGLNPSQSIEMNTRQNGYNITSDIYGYNESYYVPPMDGVKKVELVRGAASLQFGPQFGGTVNYVMREAPKNKPFEFTTQQTFGSWASFVSFNSIGGTYKKWSYYAFGQYKSTLGWRPNSDYTSFSGYGRVQYQANARLKIGAEYSILRNRIHMAGGLTDEEFNEDSRQSFRARNWIKTPWNIVTGTVDYKMSERTKLSVKSAFLFSERSLVWKNEDGGPGEADSISPITNQYVAREVEHESFNSITTEARLSHQYDLLGMSNTVAGGIRHFSGRMHRQGGGPGSTGSDFDLNLYGGGYEYDLQFTTHNVSVFVENIFRITNKLSITPGLRFEYIRSTSKGYNEDVSVDLFKNRYIPLMGIGAQYKVTTHTSWYGNITQAYRPMDYSSLTPLGVSSTVDPDMKDSYGYNADFGYKGTVKNYLNFDVSLFYMRYNKRVGLVATSDTTTMRTNVADSEHKGIEAYVEFNPVKAFAKHSRIGSISIFNSIAYVDARYISQNPDLVMDDGTAISVKGNRVEYAPRTINRTGLTYALKGFSITYTFSYTGKSYGDAQNTVYSSEAIVGVIPAYKVMDLSAAYKWDKYNVRVSVNNLANVEYFTKRTDEYPGPGIIPSQGRSIHFSFGAKF